MILFYGPCKIRLNVNLSKPRQTAGRGARPPSPHKVRLALYLLSVPPHLKIQAKRFVSAGFRWCWYIVFRGACSPKTIFYFSLIMGKQQVLPFYFLTGSNILLFLKVLKVRKRPICSFSVFQKGPVQHRKKPPFLFLALRKRAYGQSGLYKFRNRDMKSCFIKNPNTTKTGICLREDDIHFIQSAGRLWKDSFIFKACKVTYKKA